MKYKRCESESAILKQCRSKGMATLMLVVWTSLGLMSMLFSLAESKSSLLTRYKTEKNREAIRSAAGLCKNMLIARLLENARYVPQNGLSETTNAICYITSFSTSSCPSGVCGGQESALGTYSTEPTVAMETLFRVSAVSAHDVQKADETGLPVYNASHTPDTWFNTETKLYISNDPDIGLTHVYTRQISESF